MNSRSYYSKRLNVVLEVVFGPISVDSILALKAIPVRKGQVSASTRVLAFVEDDHPVSPSDLGSFAMRLQAELPEYEGTRTAIVTRHVGPTTCVSKLSSDLASNQSIKAFATSQKALAFLGLELIELFEAFPEATETVLRYLELASKSRKCEWHRPFTRKLSAD